MKAIVILPLPLTRLVIPTWVEHYVENDVAKDEGCVIGSNPEDILEVCLLITSVLTHGAGRTISQ